jgi:hypothetical protein
MALKQVKPALSECKQLRKSSWLHFDFASSVTGAIAKLSLQFI